MVPRIIKDPTDHFSPFFHHFLDRDTFLEDFFDAKRALRIVPAVNVVENKNEFILEIAVPGFEKKDFKLKVGENVLEIAAEKVSTGEEHDKGYKYLHREFEHAAFSRTYILPPTVVAEKITAKHANGMLHVVIPKRDEIDESKKRVIIVE